MSLYLKKEDISVILMPRRFEWDQLEGPVGQGHLPLNKISPYEVSFAPDLQDHPTGLIQTVLA